MWCFGEGAGNVLVAVSIARRTLHVFLWCRAFGDSKVCCDILADEVQRNAFHAGIGDNGRIRRIGRRPWGRYRDGRESGGEACPYRRYHDFPGDRMALSEALRSEKIFRGTANYLYRALPADGARYEEW